MRKYKFIARDLRQKPYYGIKNADNKTALRLSLIENGLFLSSATRALLFFEVTPNPKFSALFCRTMSELLDNGYTLEHALDELLKMKLSRNNRRALATVRYDVGNGVTLSSALKTHPYEFDEHLCYSIVAGELSNRLPQVLSDAADYYDGICRVSASFRSAFAYPLFLLATLFAVCFLMFFAVIPPFIDNLERMDVALPPITRFVADLSRSLVAWHPNFVPIFAFIFLLYCGIRGTETLRLVWDRFLLKLPVVGKLLYLSANARFCGCFGLLLTTGLPFADSVRVFGNVITNRGIRNAYTNVEYRFGMGYDLADELMNIGFDEGVATPMKTIFDCVEAGKELIRRGEVYSSLLKSQYSRIASIIQPVSLIFLGSATLFIFISTFLPLFSFINSL